MCVCHKLGYVRIICMMIFFCQPSQVHSLRIGRYCFQIRNNIWIPCKEKRSQLLPARPADAQEVEELRRLTAQMEALEGGEEGALEDDFVFVATEVRGASGARRVCDFLHMPPSRHSLGHMK